MLGLALLAGPVAAEPMAWGVNSRGNLADDQLVNALYRIDLATGATEHVGWTGALDVEGLALDEAGTLWALDDESNTLLTVNQSTGFALPVANQQTNTGIPLNQVMDFGMAFDCSGQLLASSDFLRNLYSADTETGMLTRIGEDGSLGAPITDIAVRGDEIYGIGQGIDSEGNPDSPNLYRIDPADGTAELVGPLGPAASPYANAGLDFAADGTLWAITDRRDGGNINLPSEILRIDTGTGQAVKVADADLVGFESLAISATGECPSGGPIAASPIPTLSPIGLLALVLLSFVGGMWTLRARRL